MKLRLNGVWVDTVDRYRVNGAWTSVPDPEPQPTYSLLDNFTGAGSLSFYSPDIGIGFWSGSSEFYRLSGKLVAETTGYDRFVGINSETLDVDLTVEVDALNWGGIFFGASSPGLAQERPANCWWIEVDYNTGLYNLFRNAAGVRTLMASGVGAVPGLHEWRIVAVADGVSLYVDGVQMLSYQDSPTYYGEYVGFQAGEPGHYEFDSLRVVSPGTVSEPGPEPEPEPEPDDVTLLGVGSASNSDAWVPTGPVTVGDIYVDPAASGFTNGTLESPYASLHDALDVVQDGQTILVRGGTLTPSSQFFRNTDWNTGIRVFAYGNERPVIDGGNLPGGTAGRIVDARGSNEHWKGFELVNGDGENGFVTCDGGSYYTFEDMWAHNGMASGFYNIHGAHHNTFVDDIVWRLGDGSDQQTNVPDCFVATLQSHHIDFVRCLGANGPDDNYDLFDSYDCRIIDSVSIGHGYYWNGNRGGTSSGDGYGFKLGSSRSNTGRNTVTGSLSIQGRMSNVAHNGATLGGIEVEYTTSYRAGYVGIDVGSNSGSYIRNSISYVAGLNQAGGPLWYYFGNTSTPPNSHGTNPNFADISGGDFSLAAGSSARGKGEGGTHPGASTVALKLAKKWLNTAGVTIYRN